MRHRLRSALVLGLVAWTAGACGVGREADARAGVVVSVQPQAWFVDRLAGGGVGVEVMIPPGASPASHEPTLAQLRAAHEARAYLRLGHPDFPFERAWLDRILEESGGLRVVTVLDETARREPDPHVWLVPRHARTIAARTGDALAGILPDAERAALAGRRRDLEAEIDATDTALREILAPARGRTIVTFHPAWGPLAREYDLEVLAIEHDRKEPDARELAATIERARELGAPVVFTQPQIDHASVRVVAEAVGARVETADPLAYDWSANLLEVARRFAEAAR